MIGDFLNNKLLASGIGIGAGSGVGVIPGLLAAGGTMAGGKVLTRDSAKATQEAVDNLRRMMYGKKKFVGPMSNQAIRDIGQGLGYEGREYLEDYLR
jgi:hypothetical protein